MKQLKTLLITEIEEIATSIIDEAIKDEEGWYWSYSLKSDEIITGPDIYLGNSGVTLFFIQLYRITKNKKYYDVIINSINWLNKYDYKNSKFNLSFFSGIGGPMYIYIQFYEITKDNNYLLKAIDIVKNCSNTRNYQVTDLINGTAGALLSLLHLFNFISDEYILNEIIYHINYIVDASLVTNKGICWEYNKNSIHPLCGFSHGASGYGFIFMELYNFTNYSYFYHLAIEAFNYENQYFNLVKNNWPDFRQNLYDDEHIRSNIDKLKLNDDEQLQNCEYMTAWCHGSPGIGMARLYAYKSVKSDSHLKFYEFSIISLLSQTNSFWNHGLCHGIFGNLNLMIDGFIQTNNHELYSECGNIIFKCIVEKIKNGRYSGGDSTTEKIDNSLFNGLSGIGHFFLRFLYPFQIESILIPFVKNKRKLTEFEMKIINENTINIFDTIYKKIFYNVSKLNHVYKLNANTDISNINIINFLHNATLNSIKEKKDDKLEKAYDLDIFKINNIKSPSYLFIRHKYEIEKLNNFIFSDCSCIINSDINIFDNYSDDVLMPYIITIPVHYQPGIIQIEVQQFVYDIIVTFMNRNKVETSMNILFNKYKHAVSEKENFQSIFQEQLTKCIEVDFIRICQ